MFVAATTTGASMRSIVEAGWTSDFSVQSATGDVPADAVAVAQVRALGSVATVDALVYGPAIVRVTRAGWVAAARSYGWL